MQSNLIKATFIIGVFFVASGLYISSFWGNFGINIFPYLDVSQLILYGLAPIIDNALPYIISAFIALVFLSDIFPFGGFEKMKQSGEVPKIEIITKRIVGISFFAVMPVLLIIAFFVNKVGFFHLLPVVLTLLSVFVTNYFVKQNIVLPNNFDSTIIAIVIFVLTSSFAMGKIDSTEILLNKKFKYIKLDSENYKFLGKAGEYFILTTLDNSEEIIFNANNCDYLTLYDFNEKNQSKTDTIIIKHINELKKNE